MPDGMRDRIRTAAESSGRSMNAEIVHRLQASFEESFTDAVLIDRIKELVMAKRLSDFFGSEMTEAVSIYLAEHSAAETWHDAAAELLRLGLIAAEVVPSEDRTGAASKAKK
jgi:hypothetical protein